MKINNQILYLLIKYNKKMKINNNIYLLNIITKIEN